MTVNSPSTQEFYSVFQRFQELVKAKSGEPFRGFDEGLIAVWERYKPILREHALSLLDIDAWSENEIGSGKILNHTISAIEIQDNRLNLNNNLVFWQNRFGDANRDHRVLLHAAANPRLCTEIETLLFDLFQEDRDEGVTFDRLSDLTGRKYPLLAYLYFLKDIDRFMPIQPTGFDRAFDALGISFVTRRQCSWTNYADYNAILQGLRPLIADAAGIDNVRLVDAHSFCWFFSSLIKEEQNGTLDQTRGGNNAGRIFGAREKSIYEMCYWVEQTVRNANGQIVERKVKNKDLLMSSADLEKHATDLLDRQDNCCALTGIPFHFSSPDSDKNLLPSLDRINSDGHYEAGNLQVVCRFVNFWKSASDNNEFKRLLMLVRGMEE